MLAGPGMAGALAFRIDESKSPIETEEQSRAKAEEGMASCPGRISSRRGSGKCRTNVQQAVHVHHFRHSIRFRCVEGHRMSNGDLAPLTC
jgi:hypothetical protein